MANGKWQMERRVTVTEPDQHFPFSIFPLPLPTVSDPTTTIITPPIATPAPAQVEKFESPRRRTFMHSGMTVRRFYVTHALATIFPMTAGIMLFGWRAAIVIVLTLGSAI